MGGEMLRVRHGPYAPRTYSEDVDPSSATQPLSISARIPASSTSGKTSKTLRHRCAISTRSPTLRTSRASVVGVAVVVFIFDVLSFKVHHPAQRVQAEPLG